MDALSFFVRLVEAVAWPLAALIILRTLRPEFQSLLPSMRRVKVGSFEAEFERDVQELESTIGIEVTDELHSQNKITLNLSKENARSAILDSWLKVEWAIKKAAMQQIVTSPVYVPSPLQAIHELAQLDIISAEDVALFYSLRGLRNQAAHIEEFNPSQQATLDYIRLAGKLESSLLALATPQHTR